MTATDQLRAALRDLEAKARELELDKKLETFADQADHYLRGAAVKVGDYAHDNRERVEGALARAGSTVDEKTDGKYHRTVEKLKTGVLGGVDWVAEQRDSSSTPSWASPDARWGDEPDGGASPAAPDAASTSDTPATDAPVDTPVGSADSDAWVDVTDPPPATGGSTDPK